MIEQENPNEEELNQSFTSLSDFDEEDIEKNSEDRVAED